MRGFHVLNRISPRSHKIAAAPVADGDVGELADWQCLVHHHRAIDFRGVPLAAGDAGLLDELD